MPVPWQKTVSAAGGTGVSGLLTRRAYAPVGDLDLVDGEAVVVRALKAGGLSRGAVHVRDRAAPAADHVVVVVAHAALIACRRTLGFDAPQEPRFGQSLEDVVHRLGGHRTETGTGQAEDGGRVGVRMASDRLQYRDPGPGHTQRSLAEDGFGVGLVHGPSKARFLELFHCWGHTGDGVAGRTPRGHRGSRRHRGSRGGVRRGHGGAGGDRCRARGAAALLLPAARGPARGGGGAGGRGAALRREWIGPGAKGAAARAGGGPAVSAAPADPRYCSVLPSAALRRPRIRGCR